MNNILQDLSASKIAQAMDANHNKEFWLLFRHLPQVKIHDEPGILWFETRLRYDIFNRILQTHLTPGSCRRIVESVISHFQQQHIPFVWDVGPTTSPGNLAAILVEHQLSHYETEPGMAVDLLNLNEDIPMAPPNLTIHAVTTSQQLQQWLRIWELGSSEEVIKLWFNFYASLQLNLQSPLRLYLGDLDGEPAATSGVFFGAGVASIGPIGTLPQYRQRGIGAAMTLKALREARAQNYRIAVLTASPMGIAIYRRIGFQEFCTFSTYLWHPTH